jgi:hypothetical protein
MAKKLTKILILFAIALGALPQVANAAQAGLVVKHSDGQTKISCVSFDGQSISGWQLLEKSGFNPIAKNGFIVEIDGEKTTDYQQMSEDDAFWSYWQFDGSWKFFNMGANYTTVKDGDIQGWQLSTGKNSLPQASMARICPPEVIQENTNSPSTVATVTETANAEVSASVSRGVKNVSTSTPTPIVEKSKSSENVSKVQGANDENQNNFFKFNLKNCLIIFAIFILSGLIFVFAKIKIRHFLSRRKG